MKKHISINRIILFLICLLIAIRVLYIFVPFDRDEGAYAYVGWLWFTGNGIPYLSVFDPKLPLSYIPYGIGSLLTPHSYIGLRLIAFIYEFFILFVFFKFAQEILKDRRLSIFITLLVGFFYASIRLEGSQFNTEIEMVLPMITFTYLLWRESQKEKSSKKILLLIGGIGGIALLFKSSGAIAIGGLFIWFLFYKKDILGFIIMVAGCLIPLVLVVLYFYVNNAFPAMYRDVYVYNQYYTAAGLKLSDIYIRGGATGVIGIVNWFFKMPGVIFLFTLFSLCGIVFTRKNKTALWWICTILIATLWIGIKLSGREFSHYYLFLPFALGLASMILFEKIYKRFSQKIAIGLILFFIAVIVLPEVVTLAQGPKAILYREYGSQSEWFVDAIKVGKLVQDEYPNYELLEWANEPEICYYANKKCISRYVNLYGFFYFKEDQIQWLKDIRKNPPHLIVTYANDPSSFVDVAKFLKDRPIYKEVFHSSTYIIYERNN